MGILDKISKKSSQTADVKEEKKTTATKSTKSANKDAVKTTGKKSVSKSNEDNKQTGKVKEKKAVKSAEFAYMIIRKPVLTEKSDRLQAKQNQYSFYVSVDTNKVEVARAIKELYGIKPESVRMINVKGKDVRFGRVKGRRKDRKKAIVTLKQGDSISITE